MASQAIIFLLSGISVILVAVNGFLLYHFFMINKKMDKLMEGGKIKDFKTLFTKHKEKDEDLQKQIEEAFLKIKELEKISKKTLQKVGVVRFNPFNDLGGNQSFVVALLDDRNNGFVISSFFTKETNRVFTKIIKNGKADYQLSKEELEAINKAINE